MGELFVASASVPALEWQDIATAPKDGTAFGAKVFGYPVEYRVRWETGFIDSDGRDCGGWVIDSNQTPPPCWTDGVCWHSNENEMPSAQPTHWRPIGFGRNLADATPNTPKEPS